MLVVLALMHSMSCAIMNVATGVYFFIRRRKAPAENAASKTKRTVELRLYFLSVKVFLGGVLTLAVQSIFYKLQVEGRMSPARTLIMVNVQLLLLDILICTNPWLLIAMSKPVRQQLFWSIPHLRAVSEASGRMFRVRSSVSGSSHVQTISQGRS